MSGPSSMACVTNQLPRRRLHLFSARQTCNNQSFPATRRLPLRVHRAHSDFICNGCLHLAAARLQRPGLRISQLFRRSTCSALTLKEDAYIQAERSSKLTIKSCPRCSSGVAAHGAIRHSCTTASICWSVIPRTRLRKRPLRSSWRLKTCSIVRKKETRVRHLLQAVCINIEFSQSMRSAGAPLSARSAQSCDSKNACRRHNLSVLHRWPCLRVCRSLQVCARGSCNLPIPS